MKQNWALLTIAFLVGCAGTYTPPTTGPTIELKVEHDVDVGLPLLSSTHLKLRVRQQTGEYYSGTNKRKWADLGWKRIDLKGENVFTLPADQALQVSLSYESIQFSAPTLTGGQGYVLYPEAGAKYVMTFWTDKKRFKVDLLRETTGGDRVAANTAPIEW